MTLNPPRRCFPFSRRSCFPSRCRLPDGVPWNNNNAENAIKQFAYYRQDTVGVMKEAGLKDYLVLLSLCHTCRYRDISLMKFLLSRERDIDAFGTPGRARRRRPVIEVYPRGFVPPHLARLRHRVAQKSGGPTEQVVKGGSESGVSSERGP